MREKRRKYNNRSVFAYDVRVCEYDDDSDHDFACNHKYICVEGNLYWCKYCGKYDHDCKPIIKNQTLDCNVLKKGMRAENINCVCTTKYCKNIRHLSPLLFNNLNLYITIRCKDIKEEMRPRKIYCTCKMDYCLDITRMSTDNIIGIIDSACVHNVKIGQKRPDDMVKIRKHSSNITKGNIHSLELGKPYKNLSPFLRTELLKKTNIKTEIPRWFTEYRYRPMIVFHDFFEYSNILFLNKERREGARKGTNRYYLQEFPTFSIIPQKFHITDLSLKFQLEEILLKKRV